jgi:hypothetical protein
VDGSDGGLELVGDERARRQGAGHKAHALGDGIRVPQHPVLLAQRHQRPVRGGAGRAAGVGQQHEGQQPSHFIVAGHQPVELAGQPDGLGSQLGPLQTRPRRGRVALVEDEVEHVEHDAETLRLLGRRRQLEGGPGCLDALLGTADALGHSRLRHEEGPGDLGGRQATGGPQGQGDLRGG